VDSPKDDSCPKRLARIRELNDRLRVTGAGGKTMLSRAVSALAPEVISDLLAAVAKFDAFTSDNDPWGEHDFGSVTLDGTAYFWKIDYYDLELEFGSPDPADETVTRRLVTIMTAGDM
jgi:hypothetical protein